MSKQQKAEAVDDHLAEALIKAWCKKEPAQPGGKGRSIKKVLELIRDCDRSTSLGAIRRTVWQELKNTVRDHIGADEPER